MTFLLAQGLPTGEDLKTYIIGLLIATILGAIRSWAQQKKLVGTVVAGVDLGRDRLLAALSAHPGAASALLKNGVDLVGLADHLDDAVKNGIRKLAEDAGLEPKLNAIVKATSERPAVDEHGEMIKSLLILAILLPLAFFSFACGSVPASHAMADAKMYAAAAPFARKGGLDSDTDLAWRALAGVTSTASPGGPEDPELDHGLPPSSGMPHPGPSPSVILK